MSLFEQINKKIEKPKLVTVKLLGRIRGGTDDYGNEIISMDVDDNKQFKVRSKNLKNTPKRIVFATSQIAKYYLDHPTANATEETFPCPVVEPDERNQYWIRRIYPEDNNDK